MKLNNQQKKQLQVLMGDTRWEVIEQAMKQYLMESFLDESGKRETEFETIWALAGSEGGKYHVKAFFVELEEAARGVKD